MTKKHYIAIAKVIRSNINAGVGLGEIYGIESLALALADTFAAENARFDRGRFLAACGVEEAT